MALQAPLYHCRQEAGLHVCFRHSVQHCCWTVMPLFAVTSCRPLWWRLVARCPTATQAALEHSPWLATTLSTGPTNSAKQPFARCDLYHLRVRPGKHLHKSEDYETCRTKNCLKFEIMLGETRVMPQDLKRDSAFCFLERKCFELTWWHLLLQAQRACSALTYLLL